MRGCATHFDHRLDTRSVDRHALEWRPGELFQEAARRCMAERLERVHKLAARIGRRSWLQRAEEPAHIELVHDVRVACRRAAATWKTLQELLPHSWRRSIRRLKKFRRVAGQLRDLDILVEWLRHQHPPDARQVMDTLRSRRRAAQRKLHRRAKRLVRSRLWSRTRKQLRQDWLPPSRDTANLRHQNMVRQQWQRTAEKFCHKVPTPTSSWRKWHQFRIAVKGLRYATELVAKLLPTAAMHYNELEALQELLGQMQDARVRREQLQPLRRSAKVRHVVEEWIGDLDKEARQKRHEVAKFLEESGLVKKVAALLSEGGEGRVVAGQLDCDRSNCPSSG